MRFLILASLLCTASPAIAHKVIADLFPAGASVEGEIGFSNGTMAVDQTVEIYDLNGVKHGEVITDKDGFFVWTPEAPLPAGPLKFVSNLGAGHIAEMLLAAADVPGADADAWVGSGANNSSAQTNRSTSGDSSGTSAAISETELVTLVSVAVRDELRPIRRELTQIRERNRLGNILGGIGIISALFAAFFYVSARRTLKGASK